MSRFFLFLIGIVVGAATALFFTPLTTVTTQDVVVKETTEVYNTTRIIDNSRVLKTPADVTVKRKIRGIPASKSVPYDFYMSNNDLIVEDVTLRTPNGMSMHPSIPTGHTIFTVEYEGQRLERGDVIVFKRDGGTIIHRIHGVYSDYIVTKGDNNRHIDGRINRSQVKEIKVGELTPKK